MRLHLIGFVYDLHEIRFDYRARKKLGSPVRKVIRQSMRMNISSSGVSFIRDRRFHHFSRTSRTYMSTDARTLHDCIVGNSVARRGTWRVLTRRPGWVFTRRHASINATAHVNVPTHNAVGNAARHMAARHINPKSGCWPISDNKPSRTRRMTNTDTQCLHTFYARLKFLIARERANETIGQWAKEFSSDLPI